MGRSRNHYACYHSAGIHLLVRVVEGLLSSRSPFACAYDFPVASPFSQNESVGGLEWRTGSDCEPLQWEVAVPHSGPKSSFSARCCFCRRRGYARLVLSESI